MDAGPNKAHEHPYGSTVIPTSATPPVVVATQDPTIDATIPPTVAGARVVDAASAVEPQAMVDLRISQAALDQMIEGVAERVATRVVAQVTAQLAPLVDRLMWAVEEARTPRVPVDYNKIVDEAQAELEARARERPALTLIDSPALEEIGAPRATFGDDGKAKP